MAKWCVFTKVSRQAKLWQQVATPRGIKCGPTCPDEMVLSLSDMELLFY